jgi:hypothetical protein
MPKISEIRLENARKHIELFGGVGKVASAMGYENPSFLVQVFGPNPTRNVTEKMIHKLEAATGLLNGTLDNEGIEGSTLAFDMKLVYTVIRFVGTVAESEGVQVGPDRFASLVQLALSDAIEHAGKPREAYLRQVLQLLK